MKTLIIVFAVLFSSYTKFVLADGIIWGMPTDGVKVGVEHWSRPSRTNCVVVVDIAKASTITNTLIRPLENYQRIDCSLRGTNPSLVKKTDEGKKYGAKLPTSMPHWRQVNYEIFDAGLGIGPEQFAHFNIDDLFIIKESGTYQLQIQARLMKRTSKGLVPVIFQPITVQLDLIANVKKAK